VRASAIGPAWVEVLLDSETWLPVGRRLPGEVVHPRALIRSRAVPASQSTHTARDAVPGSGGRGGDWTIRSFRRSVTAGRLCGFSRLRHLSCMGPSSISFGMGLPQTLLRCFLEVALEGELRPVKVEPTNEP